MAIMERSYQQHPAILWNLISDIVEMRKGKITHHDTESMTVETEMYGICTPYVFWVAPSPTDGTTVAVETEGETADDRRSIELMFSTLESMLGSFVGQ